MKAISVFVVTNVALLVSSAPTAKEERKISNEEQDFLRDKRSQYGVQFVSPCAAAAGSAPMPAYAPYNFDVTPMNAAYAVPQYGYTGPRYRSIDSTEIEQELLGFSDMDHVMSEHMPMARYGTYTLPSHIPGTMGPVMTPVHATPAPAIGIFPNTNAAGCNVPLLFSCTPSIVQGQVVKAQPSNSYNHPADSYRDVSDRHFETHVNRHQESGSLEHSAIHDTTHPSLHT